MSMLQNVVFMIYKFHCTFSIHQDVHLPPQLIRVRFYLMPLHCVFYFSQYLAIGNVPSRLPRPCADLNYLSIRINFNDLEECLASLCLLRSSPNLQELEMLVG